MFDNERQLMAQIDELRKAVERLDQMGLVKHPLFDGLIDIFYIDTDDRLWTMAEMQQIVDIVGV